jgi:hypothetical protein
VKCEMVSSPGYDGSPDIMCEREASVILDYGNNCIVKSCRECAEEIIKHDPNIGAIYEQERFCVCGHEIGWHFRMKGSCLDCNCLGYKESLSK